MNRDALKPRMVARLFHDHIAELPDALQAKLARPLQDATFERVGDSRTRRADVRYIAATNRDLSEQVSQGHFRQDVYFRVSVFPVEVPPLRTRPEDIPVLVEHFLAAPGSTRAGSMPRLTDAQRDHLQTYDWPGNVRELVDFVESLRGGHCPELTASQARRSLPHDTRHRAPKQYS